jgi:16S rRNA (uracil1498-N3)-methyltransferase
LHEDAAVPIADVGGATLLSGVETAEAVRFAQASACLALPTSDGATKLADARPSRPRQILVVVGPEGGISDTELAALTQAGAQAVRLGPHVMRTSTAGPVAIALLSQRLDRWI